MKNRDRQRRNRKLKHKNESLERYNTFGKKDLTAYNAVLLMKTNDSTAIVLK